MYDLVRFKARLGELLRSASPYDDGRRSTQADLASAIGLSRAALNKRLNATQGEQLKAADTRAIVRTLAEWGAITTQAEAIELLALVECPGFTAAEWISPPLDLLTASIPALATIARAEQSVQHTNLPRPLTSFVGRVSAMLDIEQQLKHTPLLTLTGPGGSGKTRLALEVSARLVSHYPAGVYLVELASLTDPDLVVSAVVQAFALKEVAGSGLTDILTDYLRPRELLLVLDNCEHLIEACASLVHHLLRFCPKLTVLVTSRERLRAEGEVSFPVPPLTFPDTQVEEEAAALSRYEAIRLFTLRAQAVAPHFSLSEENAGAVREVCQRLDGIPLALELAAGRLAEMSIKEVQQGLNDRFQMLGPGPRTAPTRQQTLAATLDWSWELLEVAQQQLFQRLAVFAGSFEPGAVAQVCGEIGSPGTYLPTLLSSLLEKNLILRDEAVGGESRYRMLETIHAYAAMRLEASAEAEVYRAAHARYYLELVKTAQPHLHSAQEARWLNLLEEEHDNLRQALTWAMTHDTGLSIELAGRLGWFWFTRGYLAEGRRFAEAALANSQEPTPARSQALEAAGALAFSQADYGAAQRFHEQALALRRHLGDERGVAKSLMNLGNLAVTAGDYASAHTTFEDGLAVLKEVGSPRNVAIALYQLGVALMGQEAYPLARIRFEEALAAFREIGDKQIIIYCLNQLATIARLDGNYAVSHELAEKSLQMEREIGEKQNMGETLTILGVALIWEGELSRAAKLLADSLSTSWEMGDREHIILTLIAIARLALQQRDAERAARLLGAVARLQTETGYVMMPLERSDYQRCARAAEEYLDEATFRGCWQVGELMTSEEVVNYALETMREEALTPNSR